MTTVFHAWTYDRPIETQRNLKRKKLHGMNQGSNFLGGSFSKWDNVRGLIQFRRERPPQQFKRWFSSRTCSSIFTSIAPVLLDWSNKTSWVFLALNKLQATSCPSPQCLAYQTQVHQPSLVVTMDQMPDHT